VTDQPGSTADERWAAWGEFRNTVPRAVAEAVPHVPWLLDELWALDLPVHEVTVRSLAWLFEIPLWRDGDLPFRVRPREVRANPALHREQYARAMRTDLSYPIHLTEWRGRLTVLDGIHRLLKADLLGVEHLPAMVLSSAQLDAICLQSPDLEEPV